MLKINEFRILLASSLVLATLIAMQVMVERSNRTLQAELLQRQAYIQQSIQLEGLYVEMIKAVAELSERSQDPALRKVLTDQGMTVQKAMQPVPQLKTENEADKLPEKIGDPERRTQ